MPASLKWIIFLLGCGFAAAAIAVPTIEWQEMRRREVLAMERVGGGNLKAGRDALHRYGCGGCHRISGVSGASGQVAPDLAGLGQRSFIAGRLPNEPDQLIRWISDPHGVDPKTAMPNLGVGQEEARDIAAYLYSLRPRSL